MKKLLCFAAVLAVLAVCPLFGCASAEKAGSIPDIQKGYFAGLEEASSLTLNLDGYVKDNGTSVTYTAESGNTDVADVEVQGSTLTAKLKGEEGNSVITVTVNSNGRKTFNLSFILSAKVYNRVACIGDSLTYGHTWHSESYPVYLQETLGNGVEVRNFGVNGSAVTNRSEGSYKLKYDTLKEYSDSIAFDPDVVVIMLGTNDGFNWTGSAPTFETEYKKLINSYLENGADRVVLLTSPPTLDKNAFNLPNETIKTEVCPKQRAMAEELSLPLVDVRAEFEARNNLQELFRTGDGVHFSVEGAKFVSKLVYDTIIKL